MNETTDNAMATAMDGLARRVDELYEKRHEMRAAERELGEYASRVLGPLGGLLTLDETARVVQRYFAQKKRRG